jgi:hypothetical protein
MRRVTWRPRSSCEPRGVTRAPHRSEKGSSLVLVLIFVTVLGLAMSVLLTAAGAHIITSDTVTRQDNKVYAADAGVAYGIQRLRLDSTACSGPGTSQTLTPAANLAINNRSVTVACTNLSGSSAGIGGFALVVTGAGGSITTSTGSEDRPVQGPLYNGGDWSGLKTNKAVDVENGSIVSGSAPCLAPGTSLAPDLRMSGSTIVPSGPFTYCPPRHLRRRHAAAGQSISPEGMTLPTQRSPAAPSPPLTRHTSPAACTTSTM